MIVQEQLQFLRLFAVFSVFRFILTVPAALVLAGIVIVSGVGSIHHGPH